jgi:hypothetical protein
MHTLSSQRTSTMGQIERVASTIALAAVLSASEREEFGGT